MTFGIFLGLIGIPALILLTAVICYVTQAKKDKELTVQTDQSGGVSQ